LNDLLEIKVLIRKTAPKHELNEKLYTDFVSKLNSLKNNLEPIFSHYLKEDITSKQSNELKQELINLLRVNYALVSSNSAKKRLKAIGVDPRHLIVSGGPIKSEDYKIINPTLTNKALENIKRKCDTLLTQIKEESWNSKDLIFIYEKKNPTDKLILNQEEALSKLIGKKLRIIELDDWKDLDS